MAVAISAGLADGTVVGAFVGLSIVGATVDKWEGIVDVKSTGKPEGDAHCAEF